MPFLKMAGKRPTQEAVGYAKEICNYIYDTCGRFPAHVNAFHFPGRVAAVLLTPRKWSSTTSKLERDLYHRQAAHGAMWGER